MSIHRIAALLFIGCLSSCASSPPMQARSEQPVVQDSPDEPDRTAEWLFVMGEGETAKGVGAECAKVAGAIKAEGDCTGELCSHGKELASEWMLRCDKRMPAEVKAVTDFLAEAKRRSALHPDPCIRQGLGLLRTQDCGDAATCTKLAQRWISRCGEGYATPLITTMLARTIERRYTDKYVQTRIDFDRRSCRTLEAQLAAAVSCDGEGCKQGLDATRSWQDRCLEPERLPSLDVAMHLASVLVGAGQPVEPIEVHPGSTQLSDNAMPLQLEIPRSAVVWVCGERPSDISTYLKVRRGCAPGEVLVAYLAPDNKVRVASVFHSSDDAFARMFPFIKVRGEQQARDRESISQLKSKLQAASATEGQEAMALLVSALKPVEWNVARDTALQSALREKDAALVSIFRQWGRFKVAQSYRVRQKERLMFMGRALTSPLADMNEEGLIAVGTYAPPRALTLEQWMPASISAYRKEIEKQNPLAAWRRPPERELERLRNDAQRAIASCAEAEKRVQAAVDEASACIFANEPCSQQKVSEVAASADSHRQAATAARRSVALIVTSKLLPDDTVEQLEADRIARGCLDP